jgi:hypothetical protein
LYRPLPTAPYDCAGSRHGQLPGATYGTVQHNGAAGVLDGVLLCRRITAIGSRPARAPVRKARVWSIPQFKTLCDTRVSPRAAF